ncbi:MAG: dihydroneopterin aldolase [Hyphomicrobiaceae bacterium]
MTSETMADRDAKTEMLTDASRRPPRMVFIDGLELLASVGVFEVEKRYEQRVVVSVTLAVDDHYDGASDRLDQVVDYSVIVDACRLIVDGTHFNLIETLAERIADAALSDPRIGVVTVKVEKPDIIAGCRSVGIAITRERTTARDAPPQA